MKAKFEKTTVLDAIGVLDRDETGDLILVVEGKDNTDIYSLNSILDEIVGTQVQIKSVNVVD